MPRTVICRRRLAALLLAGAAMLLSGCAYRSQQGARASVQVDERVWMHLLPANRSSTPVCLQIDVDGQRVYSATLAARTRGQRVRVKLAAGWHKVESRFGAHRAHTALVEANREKWLLVHYDPLKPERVGVHVSEVPLR